MSKENQVIDKCRVERAGVGKVEEDEWVSCSGQKGCRCIREDSRD